MAWSADFAYAVGLMTSDGCLSPDGRHLIFVSKDLDQVENLMRCLDLSVKVGRVIRKQKHTESVYYRVQWGNVALYKFLLEIGLSTNKSLTMGEVKVPDEYFFDFFRGSFDGDGCFYSYFDPRWKNSFMFYVHFASGSHKHILWLQKCLKQFLEINGHIHTTNRAFQLRYAKRESLILLQRMYKDTQASHLSRKKLKIEKALRIVGLTLSKEE